MVGGRLVGFARASDKALAGRDGPEAFETGFP